MHERIKICVNFLYSADTEHSINSYTDKITNCYLLNKINKFIHYLNHNNIQHIQYAYFQQSKNEYSILFYSENIQEIVYIKEIVDIQDYTDEDLRVFAYFDMQKKIKYITSERRLNYKYYDFIWKTSLTSFIQPNSVIGEYVHEKVKNILMESKEIEEFCGLGGEMGMYSKLFLKFSKSTKTLTDSQSIYEDCQTNNVSSYLVDYKTVQLKDYFHSDRKKILIVNISRNGLKDLAYQLVDIIFDKIIYIGCSEKSVHRDMEIMKTKYDIIERIQKDNIFIIILNSLNSQ